MDYKIILAREEHRLSFRTRTNGTNYYIASITEEETKNLTKTSHSKNYILSNKRHYDDGVKGLEYILRELVKAGYSIQSVNEQDFCLYIYK